MIARKIKKLPLVNADGTLLGLITAKDLLKQQQHPFATRDAQGRLRVGAAVGATGDYLERAAEVLRAGADVLVIDIAHGHSVVMERAIEELRKRFDGVELVAGNVATAEGARFLLDRGVNAHQGGHRSRRRLHDAADDELRRAAGRGAGASAGSGGGDRVPLIADGGVKRDGSIAEALLFGGDSVMLGSAFAGTEETPGEVVHEVGARCRSRRRSCRCRSRCFAGWRRSAPSATGSISRRPTPRELEAIGAEGLEVSVPARGSVRVVIHDMLKHLCSAISYGGARSLQELKRQFWAHPGKYLVKLTEASRVESFHR